MLWRFCWAFRHSGGCLIGHWEGGRRLGHDRWMVGGRLWEYEVNLAFLGFWLADTLRYRNAKNKLCTAARERETLSCMWFLKRSGLRYAWRIAMRRRDISVMITRTQLVSPLNTLNPKEKRTPTMPIVPSSLITIIAHMQSIHPTSYSHLKPNASPRVSDQLRSGAGTATGA